MMKWLLLLLAALVLMCFALVAQAEAQVMFREIAFELRDGIVYEQEKPIGAYTVQNLETQGRGFRAGRLKVYRILTADGLDMLVAISVPPPTRDEVIAAAAIDLPGSLWSPVNGRVFVFYGNPVRVFGTLGRVL